jgi:hypothetical protein
MKGHIMDSFWVDFAISIILTTIRNAVKNEESKESLKRALLKVRNAINALYPEESEV